MTDESPTSNVSALDPAGVIGEAYNIDGIGLSDCRTIFLGWVLELPDGMDAKNAAAQMLTAHGDVGHPMTQVLREAAGEASPKRRGGAMGRR